MFRKSSAFYSNCTEPSLSIDIHRKLPGHLASKLRFIDSCILTLNLFSTRFNSPSQYHATYFISI
jgi:hypothetical protein